MSATRKKMSRQQSNSGLDLGDIEVTLSSSRISQELLDACDGGETVEARRLLLLAATARGYRDEHGDTALHIAAWLAGAIVPGDEYANICRKLINGVFNKENQPPSILQKILPRAPSKKTETIVDNLLLAKNNEGNTALHVAVISKSPAVCKVLLERASIRGTDTLVTKLLSAENKLHQTALQLAREHNHQDCIKLLLEAGAREQKRESDRATERSPGPVPQQGGATVLYKGKTYKVRVDKETGKKYIHVGQAKTRRYLPLSKK